MSDEVSTDIEAVAPITLTSPFRNPACAAAVATLSTLLTLPSLTTSSPRPTASAQSAVATHATASALFNPDECRPSRLPIFRVSDILTRQPAADRADKEVADFTLKFTQWLEYFLAHPSFAGQRRCLFSNEQYCLLLGYLTNGDPDKRVVDYVVEKELDETWETWLYHETTDSTYQYMMMSYRGASVDDMQIAPVLVCLKEPAIKPGGKVSASPRPPHPPQPDCFAAVRRTARSSR